MIYFERVFFRVYICHTCVAVVGDAFEPVMPLYHRAWGHRVEMGPSTA